MHRTCMDCVLRTSPLLMMARTTVEQKSTLKGDMMNEALTSLSTVSVSVHQLIDLPALVPPPLEKIAASHCASY